MTATRDADARGRWYRPRVPAQTGTPTNNSIARAARLLGLFSIEEPELTLAEIGRRLGMTKATAHRYALALRRSGLLTHTDGAYALGPRIIELASVALAGLQVVKLAGPHLEALVNSVRETAVLSVWDGEAPVVVRMNDNTGRLVQVRVAIGSRLPAQSAQGQVFRAYLEQTRAKAIADVRARGYASNVTRDGIAAIAAPVLQGSEIAATVALVGTASSIDARPSGRMVAGLLATAGALSRDLGFVETKEE